MGVQMFGGGGPAGLLLGSNTPNNGTTEAVSGINSIFAAYTQLVASLATQGTGWCICGTVDNGLAAATKFFFQLAIGAAASEVIIAQAKMLLPAGVGSIAPLILSSNQLIPAGTRIAFRSYVEGGTAANVLFGWSISRK